MLFRSIIDVSRLDELRHITMTDEGLSIGALVTHTQIMQSPIIREMFPALVEAAHTIGAVQTRNLGTLGGNLVTGVPSMDSGPTLVALDALATVLGPAGRRQVPLAEFFLGPRKTVLKPEELLVEIVIPKQVPAHDDFPRLVVVQQLRGRVRQRQRVSDGESGWLILMFEIQLAAQSIVDFIRPLRGAEVC